MCSKIPRPRLQLLNMRIGLNSKQNRATRRTFRDDAGTLSVTRQPAKEITPGGAHLLLEARSGASAPDRARTKRQEHAESLEFGRKYRVCSTSSCNNWTRLLFLHIHASDVVVGHVRPLLHELNGRVALGRQDLHDAVAVPVQSHRGVRLEHLPVKSAQNANEVVGTRGRT